MKKMAFIDMEGVIIPEIWKHFSHYFNIPELAVTTREVADYKQLMNQRINILKNKDISLNKLLEAIAELEPNNGAKDFLKYLQLNKNFEVRIISDCFYEFLDPFLKKIGIPSKHAYCHYLEVDSHGIIEKVHYLRNKGKHEIIVNYQKNNFSMKDSIAIGDAFNDFTMLHLVDHGFLFQPSEDVRKNAPFYFHTMQTYEDIINYLNNLKYLKRNNFQA
ncbi:TPA: bifunctional phosphoserine phosphatase/homoserine phosphotransferase ThrH [Acinetobacter baumannii]|uniref:bifunctional phosphoserine phosphatase/homoserine phosphotransferase ThrH n=1 Tax=Acinetobacter baumannii TaxID=470 RepID=UPI0013C55CB1|nr:bifunctional phosphoserine phosphatase/homoserine phosphotransferase ThrH [Acinetobacter baumannii]NDW26296.1 bifunctional phosphoserine phosphatase/homoserine phosphotransferase ThrH [Acinetobacter baumannii]HBM1136467.1 bifunctional phosphoserine phosphatase/homoserine phosphotransferase ThrH [Acinetobacter baumannii]